MLEDIKHLPKIELHVHLDGSINHKTVYKWLDGKELLENINKFLMVSDSDNSLDDYLTKFELPLKLLQTKGHLIESARDLVAMLKEDNVIYAEVRFAPQLHTKDGLSYDEIITSVIEGLTDSNIKVNLILCCMRGNDNWDDNIKTVEYAAKYLHKGVCAIDLAGSEKLFPTSDYEYIFTICQNLKVPYTIHAGEADSDESINDALKFGTKRLGHGINYNNSDIIKRYLNDNIALEICPTSNLNTKVVKDIKRHPIYELYKQGVLTTINTDNRTVSNTNLNNEYWLLAKTFNFTIFDFKQMNINAIKAAFISDEEKKQLLECYGEV